MTFDTSPPQPLDLTHASHSESGVSLPPHYFQQSGQLSQAALDSQQQWSVYQQGLALFGFEQWLMDRHIEFRFNHDRCSTLQACYANFLTTACNVMAGAFNLCIVPLGSLGELRVSLPRATVEMAEFSPHFYVMVEVQEENNWIEVKGVLSREQLMAQLQETQLQATANWTYDIPTQWFEHGGDELLLWIRTADVTQLAMPQPTATISAAIRDELVALQPQLGQAPLWQVLSWEQYAAVLAEPEWANWLYNTLSAAEMSQVSVPELVTDSSMVSLTEVTVSEVAKPLSSGMEQVQQTLAHFKNRTINVGLWLQDQLDDIANELSWVLMPPMTAGATGLRSAVANVDAIIGELGRKGLNIPVHARGAYRDLNWEDTSLRLYVVIWPQLSETDVPEWNLLVVLGPQPGDVLPTSTRLLVRDAAQLLVDQTPSGANDDSYLYARVIGTWEEKFWVTIELDRGDPRSSIFLPPFRFNPGSIQI